ncbi:MAG: hypothetical protein A2Y10_10685 [Planctomycetes bacterium GWF2_41_51]|nr:MAG: hypothetical protein A2Y10_10685 [Planctomycetes bacterium GWF2_41_51]HBG28489.1 hypothetical protein [Phycisphaerales bacterium]
MTDYNFTDSEVTKVEEYKTHLDNCFTSRRQEVAERRSESRRTEEDRRVCLDRRRGPGKRRSDERRCAEEGQMTDEQFEFVMAVDQYKKQNNKPFPSWTEILEVLKAIGYRKVAEPCSIKDLQNKQQSEN